MGRPPSLLFVAPIFPAEAGNGLAMRAGVFLDALARDHAVSLLVVPVAGGPAVVTPFVAGRTVRVVTLNPAPGLDPLWTLCERVIDPEERANALAAYPRPAPCRFATSPVLLAARQVLAGEDFAAVHVLRSYLAPYAAHFLGDGPARPFASLDLDDDEAPTRRRLAALHAADGRAREARIETAEADKFARHEAEWLPRFHCLIACTPAHAARLAASQPACRTAVVPNTVAVPARPARRLFRFGRHILFVGNLSYLPNVDGIRHFVREILPLLRARAGGGVTLRIAGGAPAPAVRELAAAGIQVVADPPDLARHYRWADLAVIPLRAGGGTRIKLLEAFAHRVPVVATTIGAEGIEAVDRRHLLLADTPAAFAAACAELLGDRALADRLADEAARLVRERYSTAVGVRAIRAALAPSGALAG